MAGDLRGFALEKAEFISRRFRELLSSGEGYIRAHFGVDLSLKAEQWVILFLFTAAVGLLMLAVSCTGVCGGLLGGKKRRSLATSEGNTESDKASLAKSTAKSEEQRKKNKKKLTEKVAQTRREFRLIYYLFICFFGQVHEAQTTLPMKKNKKKPKLDMKPTQQLSTAEGKEQDEGAWETKVSNREKRQQRKKERGPDDSGNIQYLPSLIVALFICHSEAPANTIEQWSNPQDVEDEWTGFNGMTAVDPSSDWNAPVEHWGNYEEPSAVEPPVFSLKEQAATKLSEDEKDNEDPSDAAKSKKRRRKKKKTEEETASQARNSNIK
uniref:Metadherin a n=1 Tax=Neogobius melanostomus TaxID=47308 RepID=A0A8C6S8L8_9GOBI